MGAVTGKTWLDHSEPRIMAADLEAIEAAAASTIVGVGRPDIPATLTPDVATRVASATSGTVFRSTDGPQGAWEWMKQGSTWVVSQGDTGLRTLADRLTEDWQPTSSGLGIRRIGSTVHVYGGVSRRTSGGALGGQAVIAPLIQGFPPPRKDGLRASVGQHAHHRPRPGRVAGDRQRLPNRTTFLGPIRRVHRGRDDPHRWHMGHRSLVADRVARSPLEAPRHPRIEGHPS